MRKFLNIFIPILLCFLVGWISSYYQAESVENWYPYLVKPKVTPPSFVFPIAWSILYVCMGVSIGLILNSDSRRKRIFIILFTAQLFLNFLWSIIFFYLQNPLLGFIEIIMLDLLVITYIVKTYPHHKASSILFMPYIAWLLFATYLNFYIFIFN